MAATVTIDTLARFRAFIEATQMLLPSADEKAHASEEAALQEFKKFIKQAKPLVLKDIRRCLVDHRAELDHLATWLIPSGPDLLSVALLAGSENAYTELIGWMLYPPGYPRVALRCQRALLASLGLAGKKLIKPVQPQTQFDTDISRPDLVMHFEKLDFVLVVEAKTGSDEHETPDGVPQTLAYAAHVRNKLGLADVRPPYQVKVVYLTLNGAAAENPEAILITYLDLVRTLGLALRLDALPDSLRWSYANIFTHFLTCATPEDVDVADALGHVSATASRSKKALDNATILSNIGAFEALAGLFPREMTL